MSVTTDPRSLPEHEYFGCGERISQRYAENEPLRARATLYAWWGLSDDQQEAVHRVCCGESWTNVADLAVMQDFETSANKLTKELTKGAKRSDKRSRARLAGEKVKI